MMDPTFILSYPRSRTAWLSLFLTGAGAYCFHEAWKLVDTIEELRELMESKGPGPVVNSDCANIFFLKELRAAFPTAKYVRLVQDEDAVRASLIDSYGPCSYDELFAQYRQAFQGVTADLTIECAGWSLADTEAVWRVVSGGKPFDPLWAAQCHAMLVQLMPQQIQADIKRAQRGDFAHISERARGASWA